MVKTRHCPRPGISRLWPRLRVIIKVVFWTSTFYGKFCSLYLLFWINYKWAASLNLSFLALIVLLVEIDLCVDEPWYTLLLGISVKSIWLTSAQLMPWIRFTKYSTNSMVIPGFPLRWIALRDFDLFRASPKCHI